MGEMAGEARVFRLDPAKQAALVRPRLAWTLGSFLVISPGFIFLMTYVQRGQPHPMSAGTLALCFAFAFVLAAVVMVRTTKKALQGYRLLLAADWLRIEAPAIAPQTITRAEVLHVREHNNGIELRRRRGIPMGITRAVAGYEEIRPEILSWAPAPAGKTPSRASAIGVLQSLGGLATFVLCPLSQTAKTPLVSLTLTAFAAIAATAFARLMSGLLPKRSWLARNFFYFIAGAIVLLSVMRWTGLQPH
jgi:hypothetical protein